ncbi:MAG: two component transcriptional regulator, LuxR family [Mycobacterium sp.]|nr:two component transcriptional regulator, LuxR family [Mycobacterium sp.]
MTIRVLLVDDHPLLRLGFSLLIDAEDDMRVVGQAADGVEAVALAASLSPDVVLMDVRMPVLDGIAAARRIIADRPAAKVVILTTFDLDEYAFESLRAGASGFLLKNTRPEELLAGVRAVASGDALLSPSTTRRLLDTYAGVFGGGRDPVPVPRSGYDPLSVLTSRERDVFTLLVAGLSNPLVAERLGLSESTVKTHVAHLLAKLDLRDRVHAVIFAYENGLVSREPD